MGYSPRERLGLIMLILVVIGLFLTERLIDSAGCERTENAVESYPTQNTPADSSKGKWMSRGERSEAYRRSDSIKDKRKAAHKDSLKSKSKQVRRSRKKGGSNSGKSSPQSSPQRRSLRDERL